MICFKARYYASSHLSWIRFGSFPTENTYIMFPLPSCMISFIIPRAGLQRSSCPPLAWVHSLSSSPSEIGLRVLRGHLYCSIPHKNRPGIRHTGDRRLVTPNNASRRIIVSRISEIGIEGVSEWCLATVVDFHYGIERRDRFFQHGGTSSRNIRVRAVSNDTSGH